MGNRYYKFFAVMRQAITNKQLAFSAPANKKVYQILNLLRERGLIAGFGLDLDIKGYWLGYPRYKVHLKYNYLGVPVIKKLDCFKLTKTNFTTVKEQYPRIMNSTFWLISDTSRRISLLNSLDFKRVNNQLIAKIKI